MHTTTYTILVTIVHDEHRPAPSPGALSDHIQQALEEGTDRHQGCYAATATAMTGELVQRSTRTATAIELHRNLRGA